VISNGEALDEMGGICSTHRNDEKFIQDFFFGNPEENRPLGRPRRRLEDIRMDLG
jgi:hypothetical protein